MPLHAKIRNLLPIPLATYHICNLHILLESSECWNNIICNDCACIIFYMQVALMNFIPATTESAFPLRLSAMEFMTVHQIWLASLPLMKKNYSVVVSLANKLNFNEHYSTTFSSMISGLLGHFVLRNMCYYFTPEIRTPL